MTLELRLGPGEAERACFIGNTRSGKTRLVQAILALPGMSSVVVIDSKHVPSEWEPFARQHGYVVSRDPEDIRRHPLVVHRVDMRAITDRAGWGKPGRPGWAWTLALQNVIERGNTLLVFDEAMHTLPSTAPNPEARRLATQGAAMGIGLFVLAQAPVHVDTVALAQAEHCFAFVQHNPEYRQVVHARRGVDCEVLAELDPFEFAYHRHGMAGWEFFEPIRLPRRRPTPQPTQPAQTRAAETAATAPELVAEGNPTP